MKTIDEVIGMAERCTLPYPGDCLNCEYFEDDSGNDCRCKILADALHYLREYRDRKETLRYWTEKAISEQQNLSDTVFMQAYRKEQTNDR